MTKQELAKYAGNQIYVLATRMGGKFKTIYCITVYEITKRGTFKYKFEAMSCVANKEQTETANRFYPNRFNGRPSAEKMTVEEIERLIK